MIQKKQNRKEKTMNSRMICDLCGQELKREDPGHLLVDNRLVCRDCLERRCVECDECRHYAEAGTLISQSDDYRICENCYRELLR